MMYNNVQSLAAKRSHHRDTEGLGVQLRGSVLTWHAQGPGFDHKPTKSSSTKIDETKDEFQGWT